MAEPLSIAASVAGLISLAEVVFRRTYKFLRHVKNAEREITDLSIAINSLCGVLRSIELVVDELQAVDSVPGLSRKEIHECTTTLNEVREKLSPFEKLGSTAQVNGTDSLTLHSKLKWPFSRSAMIDILQKIHDHKSQLSLTLVAENVILSVETFKKTSSVQETVAKTYSLMEAETKIAMDERKEHNLRLLSPVRPLDNHKTNNGLRHKGTVLWFLESSEFQTWLSTANAALWVWGIPGAGKTILASAAIQESLQTHTSAGDNAVAYFYCDYKNADTQQAPNVLGSLAQEIARQNEGAYQKLEAFIKTHRLDNRNKLANEDNPELSSLILDMSHDFDTVTILIDGLDECGDQAEIVTSYVASLNHKAINIKLFLASRDLPQIREKLDGFENISIAARNSDLKLYVGAQIEERLQKTSIKRLRLRDPSLKGQIMDNLVDGAQGMFRWVALQLDIICEQASDKGILVALKSLSRDLFASYERILQNISRKAETIQTLVCRTLYWVVARRRINARALCEAISIEANSNQSDPHAIVDIENVLYYCGSFVRKNGEDLELAHFTVQEFLASPRIKENLALASYWVGGDSATKYMACTCLTYLGYENFRSSCQSFKDLQNRHDVFPFRLLAVSSWVKWAREHENDQECAKLEQNLFSEPKRGNLYSWDQEYLHGSYLHEDYGDPDMEIFDEDTFDKLGNLYRFVTPLHYAAMLALPEQCSWLLSQGNWTPSASLVGSPIHCALLGPDLFEPEYGFVRRYKKKEVRARECTVRRLLRSGVEALEQWTNRMSGETFSTLYIAYDSFPGRLGRGIVCSLIESGCHCYPDFLEKLSETENPDDFDLVSFIKPENLDESSRQIFVSLLMKTRQTGNEDFAPRITSALAIPSKDPEFLRRLFFDAASEGCLEVVEHLVDRKVVTVDLSDDNGESALTLATKFGKARVVEYLSSHGAFLEKLNLNGQTALHVAISNDDLECFQILARHGADFKAKDKESRTILHIAADVPSINHGFLPTLKTAFQGHDDLVNFKDRRGWTALAIAAQCQSPDILSLLMGLGADMNILDDEGRTVLHLAASNGNHDAVEFFLSKGVDPASRDLSGLNVLYHAVSSRRLQSKTVGLLLDLDIALMRGAAEYSSAMDGLIKALLSENDAASKRDEGWESVFDLLIKYSPDRAAHLMDHHCSVDLLLDDGRRAKFHLWVNKVLEVSTQDQDSTDTAHCIGTHMELLQSDTLMSREVSKEVVNIICSLIDLVSQTDLAKIKNGGGRQRSLLCAIAMHGKPSQVQKLLELGFEVDETGTDGMTPLAGACKARSDNVELLLQKGADTSLKSDEEWAPVHWAAFRGNLPALKLLADRKDCWTDVCYLPKQKNVIWTDISYFFNQNNGIEAQLPELAILSQNFNSLEYLIDKHEEFSVDNCAAGGSLLSLATATNQPAAIHFLINRGVDCSKPIDSTLFTPLHIAGDLGDTFAAKRLLEAGANLHATDKSGCQPWVHAVRAGHKRIVHLLRSADGKTEARFAESSSALRPTVHKDLQHALAIAIYQHDLDSCKALVDQGAILSAPCNDCEICVPLLYALERRAFEVARYIIEEGGSVMGVKCDSHTYPGYTALHYTARDGQVDLMNAIVDREPALLFIKSAIHPIHVAVLAGENQLLESMLRRISTAWVALNLNKREPLGKTLDQKSMVDQAQEIHKLKEQRHTLIGTNLLDVPMKPSLSEVDWSLPAGLTSRVFTDGTTPLHCAVRAHNVDAVHLLLKAGATVDCPDENLDTPLHAAIRAGASEIAGILLDFGANPHSRDIEGRPIRLAAIRNQDMALYQRLYGQNVDPSLAGVPAVEYILLLASKGMDMPTFNELYDIFFCLVDGSPVVETFLLHCGWNLAAEIPLYGSILNDLAWKKPGNLSLMKRLMKRLGPEDCLALLNKKPEDAVTPLYTVAASGRHKQVALMLKHGANPDVIGGRLGTPLMAAAKMGRASVVQMLVDSGASVCYEHEGQWFSVLDQAKLFPEIVNWLLRGRWMRWRFLEWK